MTRVVAILAAVVALAVPARAAAQSTAGVGTLYYGISAGLGERHVSGALPATELPASAPQPPSRAVGTLGLEGGLGLGPHVALIGIFDKGAALSGTNQWGSLAADAVVRAWVAPSVWVEGGLNLTELAFQPTTCAASPAACSQATLWHAGVAAGGGYELFRGPTVTIHVFARYAQASFAGLEQRTFTVQVGLLGRR
jgi:hypothetical protein